MKARTTRARMAIAGLIGSAALAGPVTAALSAGQVVNAQPSTPKDTSDAVEPAVTTAVTTAATTALPDAGGTQAGAQDQTVQGIFGQLALGQPTDFQRFMSEVGNPPAGTPLPFDGLSGLSPATQGLTPMLSGGTQVTDGTLGTFQLAAIPPGAPTNPLAPMIVPTLPFDTTIPLNVLPYPGDPNVPNGGFSIVPDPASGVPVLKFSTFDGSASITYQPGDAVVLPGGTSAIRVGTDSQGNPALKIDSYPNYPYPAPTYLGPTRGADDGTGQEGQPDQVVQNTNPPATDPATTAAPPADQTQQPPQADPPPPQPQDQPTVTVASLPTDDDPDPTS